MIAGTLAWLTGIVVLQCQPGLPVIHWLLLLPVSALAAWRCRRCRWVAIAVCGYLWALGNAHWSLDRALPAALEGVDVLVSGHVTGIPERNARRLRMRFQVERLIHAGKAYRAPGQVRLNWYGRAPAVASGEHWQLKVRLKRPRGFSNPGGFDYEGWLYREGVRATGYV